MLRGRKLYTDLRAALAKSPLDPKKKSAVALRSYREVRIQSKLAQVRLQQRDPLQEHLLVIENKLQELKQTRSVSRESTRNLNLSRTLVKASPTRTRSAGRGLYKTSADLVQLAKIAKSLLASDFSEEDTDEGRTNTRLLRSLQISRNTKCNKEREEWEKEEQKQPKEQQVRVRLVPVFSVSPLRRGQGSGALRSKTRIESLKCSPKTLDDPDVQPEPTVRLPRN